MAIHTRVSPLGAGYGSFDTTTDLAAWDLSTVAPGTPAVVAANGGSIWAAYPTGTTPPAGAVTVTAVNGVWVLQSFGQVTSFVPAQYDTTGAQSAVAGILAAIVIASALGLPVRLPPGTALVDSTIPVPSDVKILGSVIGGTNRTIVKCALPTSGPITAGAAFLSIQVAGTTGLLATSNTPGTTTVLSTINPAVGSWVLIVLTGGIMGSIYRVVSSVPTGPNWTVTLDRPVLRQYSGTSPIIQLVSRPENNVFAGLTFTGACMRYIEQAGAYRGLIADCVFDGSIGGGWSDQATSFDVGSTECRYLNNKLIGGVNNGTHGLAGDGLDIESGEGCDHLGSVIEGRGYIRYGVAIYDGTDILVTTKAVSGCTGAGGWIGADLGVQGSQSVRFIGGHFNGNLGAGILVSSGSGQPLDNVVMGNSCRFNGGGGIVVDGSVAAKNTLLVGNDCTDNTVPSFAGISVTAGAIGTILSANDCSRCWAGVLLAAEAKISGLVAKDCTLTCLETLAGTFDVSLQGFDLSLASGSFAVSTNNSRTELSDGTIDPGAAGYGITIFTAGLVIARTTRVTRGAVGVDVAIAGATFRQGNGCDFSGAATPVNLVANAHCNRKQTVAGAAGGTAVAWPDLKSTDTVLLKPQAAVFTGYVSTFTPGTGFTVTDAAAGTYEYYIP